MKIITHLTRQLKPNLSIITLVIVMSILVLGAVFEYHLINDIPLKTLTSDITVAANVPLYFGIQSQMGIFFWAASAAISFFATLLIETKKVKLFFLVSAFISLLLGIDDLFLLHETVFPSIGIHQKVVFLSYAILMGVYVLKFQKILLKTDYILFLMAIGSFGTSLLVDNFLYESSPIVTQLVEDGAKFIGLLFWTAFYSKTAYTTLDDQLKSTGSVSV